jgi:hypothetical protein
METEERVFNEEKFRQVLNLNPKWSSLVVFSQIIKHKKLSKPVIKKNFYNFVDKEDWSGSPVEEILNWVYELSNEKIIRKTKEK